MLDLKISLACVILIFVLFAGVSQFIAPTISNASTNATATATAEAQDILGEKMTANATGQLMTQAENVLALTSDTASNATQTAMNTTMNILSNASSNVPDTMSNASTNETVDVNEEANELINAASNALANATKAAGTTMTPGQMEALINYCYENADRPNPIQDLIDKGFLPSGFTETCKSVKQSYDEVQTMLDKNLEIQQQQEETAIQDLSNKIKRYNECERNINITTTFEECERIEVESNQSLDNLNALRGFE